MRSHTVKTNAAVGTQAPLGTPVEKLLPRLWRNAETIHLRTTHSSRRMGFLMALREMTKAVLGDSKVPGKRT